MLGCRLSHHLVGEVTEPLQASASPSTAPSLLPHQRSTTTRTAKRTLARAYRTQLDRSLPRTREQELQAWLFSRTRLSGPPQEGIHHSVFLEPHDTQVNLSLKASSPARPASSGTHRRWLQKPNRSGPCCKRSWWILIQKGTRCSGKKVESRA